MLRFGATIFNDDTSFEVVLREAIDTLTGANPKHCCWVEISRAMDSRDLIIFSLSSAEYVTVSRESRV